MKLKKTKNDGFHQQMEIKVLYLVTFFNSNVSRCFSFEISLFTKKKCIQKFFYDKIQDKTWFLFIIM